MLLDTSYKLRILMYENRKKQTSEVSLVEYKSINLADLSLKRLIRSLELIPWQKIVLSEKAI